MQISTDGIVLRSHKYEENRILTLLTRNTGVVTAYANYANRPRSPLSATTELLCYSNFQLFKSKDNYNVDKADSKRIFFGIRSNYENLALASYWAQLFAELSPKEEVSTDYINLLLGCLHYLEEGTRPPILLKAVAELRLLTLAGYMPNLVGCEICGEFETDPIYFSLNGSLLCGNCHSKVEGTGHLLPISQSVLASMRHIVYADSRKIYSFRLEDQSYTQLAKITEQYLLHHLEKTLPTLEFYRAIADELLVAPPK